MATFPNSVDPATTGGVEPSNISLPNRAIDPTQIYVEVHVPASLLTPPQSGRAATVYRLSNLIAYIVATAKGQ